MATHVADGTAPEPCLERNSFKINTFYNATGRVA